MDRIRALRNPIRHYDWGSREAIARWSGRPWPSDRLEAEQWLGAHPSDPSHVLLDERGATSVRLDDWIARDPGAALGPRVAAAFGSELPFLFKVLAAERALSIQTHPDAALARAGFARENAARIPLDAPERSYRDPHAKPELICALTRFSALCDFRSRQAVASELDELGIDELMPVADLALKQGSAAALGALLRLDLTKRSALAKKTASAVAGAREPALVGVARLAEQHAGDIGILAPIFMNQIELAAGEALYLEAGMVHAYLEGFAVELMGNSDNTLRGGLTTKHVDVDEFLAVLATDEELPDRLSPVAEANGARRYATSAAEFELRRFAIRAEAPLQRAPGDGPEIWLCTSGGALVRDTRHSAGIELARGSAVWVPASAGPFEVEGSGEFHVAGVPAAVEP